MVDKTLLMFAGGIRTATKVLADGKEHALHFHARTPNQIAVFVGAQNRVTEDEAGDLARQNIRAKFIAESLCTEDGSPLMTEQEAQQIPATLKPELCQLILKGSSEIGDAGKG